MISQRPFLIWILMIVFVFALTGCKTYEYFTIDILEPADIFLPEKVKKVLITHNVYPDTSKSEGTRFVIFGESITDTILHDSVLVNRSLQALSSVLLQVGDVYPLVDDSAGYGLPIKSGDFTERHVERIRNQCRIIGADAFLVLNSLSKEVIYDIYYGDFGSVFGEFQANFSSQWLLIDPFASKLIHSKIIYDTLYLPDPRPMNSTDVENYNNSINLLKEGATLAGIKYASYISPHYAQTERLIFLAGNKAIKKGYEKAKTGDWKQAALFWREALINADDKIRAKASFNLALASEMEGMLDAALGWAEESYLFFPDTLNSTYIKILKERISDQNDILIQIEGRKK